MHSNYGKWICCCQTLEHLMHKTHLCHGHTFGTAKQMRSAIWLVLTSSLGSLERSEILFHQPLRFGFKSDLGCACDFDLRWSLPTFYTFGGIFCDSGGCGDPMTGTMCFEFGRRRDRRVRRYEVDTRLLASRLAIMCVSYVSGSHMECSCGDRIALPASGWARRSIMPVAY